MKRISLTAWILIGLVAGALVALCVPEAAGGGEVTLGVMEGVAEASQASGCPVVGGDVSAAGVLVVSVTVMGTLGGGTPVLRSGAAAGDAIFHNLGLLFAIGVAVGFAKDGNGAAGLAGCLDLLVSSDVRFRRFFVFFGAADLALVFFFEAFVHNPEYAVLRNNSPTGVWAILVTGWPLIEGGM